MKKIGIVTITIGDLISRYNYGNKLQNYAMQKYLENQGYQSSTILHRTIYPDYTIARESEERNNMNRNFSNIIERIKRKIYSKLYNKVLKTKEKNRNKKFNDFNKEFLNYTEKEYNTSDECLELNNIFDTFIVGSDQIWNPYYEGTDSFAYLDFAPKAKRISYAPSIGINYIPNEIKDSFIKWISNIEYRSIREDSGKKLLLDNGIDNVKLVCDPVFLLDKKEWESISAKSNIKTKYFAVYMLGSMDKKVKKYIRELAKKTGFKMVDIYNLHNKNSMFAGPTEFLSIIKNSEFLLTDSFHGMAFSVIFDKAFVLIDRNHNCKKNKYDMSSRMDSLLRLIDCDNRDINYILDNIKEIYNKNYNKEKLNQLIKESKKYLNDSITESLK